MEPSPQNLAVDDDVIAVDDLEPADLLYEDLDTDALAAPPPIAERFASQYEYSPAAETTVDVTDGAVVIDLNRAAGDPVVSTERRP
ncbi:MAG: hypothetical protein QOG52_2059 [Frankiaceae bacterium]|jgi:hypothetical protein|nr:hypothetical protein [Frankiaceae bacterium]